MCREAGTPPAGGERRVAAGFRLGLRPLQQVAKGNYQEALENTNARGASHQRRLPRGRVQARAVENSSRALQHAAGAENPRDRAAARGGGTGAQEAKEPFPAGRPPLPAGSSGGVLTPAAPSKGRQLGSVALASSTGVPRQVNEPSALLEGR